MVPIAAHLDPATPVMVTPMMTMMPSVMPPTIRPDDNARRLCWRARHGDAAKSDHSSNQ